jgi:hypothetical protein
MARPFHLELERNTAFASRMSVSALRPRPLNEASLELSPIWISPVLRKMFPEASIQEVSVYHEECAAQHG